MNFAHYSLTADAYEAFLERELRTATVLKIREHPCIKQYIPKKKVSVYSILLICVCLIGRIAYCFNFNMTVNITHVPLETSKLEGITLKFRK